MTEEKYKKRYIKKSNEMFMCLSAFVLRERLEMLNDRSEKILKYVDSKGQQVPTKKHAFKRYKKKKKNLIRFQLNFKPKERCIE